MELKPDRAALADEIEAASEGLFCMMVANASGYSLGIEKTAMIVAALRADDGMREQAQRALDHYDMRSEMYTNDADLARNMATILRTALAASGEKE